LFLLIKSKKTIITREFASQVGEANIITREFASQVGEANITYCFLIIIAKNNINSIIYIIIK
jgi:hypothetical protein